MHTLGTGSSKNGVVKTRINNQMPDGTQISTWKEAFMRWFPPGQQVVPENVHTNHWMTTTSYPASGNEIKNSNDATAQRSRLFNIHRKIPQIYTKWHKRQRKYLLNVHKEKFLMRLYRALFVQWPPISHMHSGDSGMPPGNTPFTNAFSFEILVRWTRTELW